MTANNTDNYTIGTSLVLASSGNSTGSPIRFYISSILLFTNSTSLKNATFWDVKAVWLL
jgi:hypothetical protein